MKYSLIMEKTIEVIVKNNFGNDLVYPKCDEAIMFAKISGHKTLTPYTIQLLKDNGYTVKVVPEVDTL